MGAVGPTPDAGPDERELVERARSDPDAFAVLYRRHVGRIHAFAYRRSRSREIAEEVTAATFERALRGLPGFEWRAGGFGPWLYRIAANELADHYRRERRATELLRRQVAAVDEPHDPEHETASADALPALLGALGCLNPRYQTAISLRYLAGLSHEEAASAMGCSKPVMAVTLHRALAALRRALAQEGAR